MSPETRTEIRLELTLDGDGLSGRLGLMHAIDELLALPASPDDDGALAPGDGAGKE